MRRVRFFTVFMALSFFALAAEAAPVCGKHPDLVKRLQDGYGERRIGLGVAGNHGLVEVYISASGSFTILFTRPNGLACIMAAGERWEIIEFRGTPAAGRIGRAPARPIPLPGLLLRWRCASPPELLFLGCAVGTADPTISSFSWL